MKTLRTKLDYNHLLETIDEVVTNSRSKIAKRYQFGIEIGLNMLTSYLKQIAERAIELNDEVLIGLLEDLMIVKKQNFGEELMEAQRRLEDEQRSRA